MQMIMIILITHFMFRKANLASICEKCHDWIHANDFRCEKRKTSDGYELILK